MNVAKWLLMGVLALPLAELLVFIAVASAIGFAYALLLQLILSLVGIWILRHAGGNHIARVRVAMAQGSFTSLQADETGGRLLLAGILLLIPGFITDFLGLLLLLGPLGRMIMGGLGSNPPPSPDGVVDLEPGQWRRVPDPTLDKPRDDDPEGHR